MKNAKSIGPVARQIISVCQRIDTLNAGVVEMIQQSQPEIALVLDEQIAGQTADLQQLVLQLTELVMPSDDDDSETNTDEGEGSVFAEGDLDDVKNKETNCRTGGIQK